jgi:hypothetical protein
VVFELSCPRTLAAELGASDRSLLTPAELSVEPAEKMVGRTIYQEKRPPYWDAPGHHRNRGGANMIANDKELKVTLERIGRFQEQVAHLRRMETNPENYHGAVSGFLAEIDRMQLEVREYLSIHPAEVASTSTS